MKRGILLLLGLLVLPLAAAAIGPHEILILVNTNSADSVRIGETYARLRRVPEANVVRLGVPVAPSMTVDAFRSAIFEPVSAEVRKRGVGDHILAWVYAPGFPWRIDTTPPMSLTGLTFTRGVPPVTNEVAAGDWLSPFYAGPNFPHERGFESRSLCMLSEWMGPDKPIAAWVLAHVGERGLTADEAGAMLVRGLDSDGTRPTGAICFVLSNDIRTRTREWEFPGTIDELVDFGLKAEVVTNGLPRGVDPLAGLLTGQAAFETAGTRLAAGALVDNLTSFGAAFTEASQTKATAWLAAGAVASGGTVTEPYSIWTKFPHARVFVHYAAGCTALESYYQSIRQPLQYLPMGDPLAAPWKPKGEVTVEGMDEVLAGTRRELAIGVRDGGKATWNSYQVLVDGREAGRGVLGEPHRWDPAQWGPGNHELRVVVRTAGLLRHQVFAVRPYTYNPPDSP